MSFFRIVYYFSRAMANIRQTPYINIITTAVIATAFMILGTFLMLVTNVNEALRIWENKFHIEAYIDPAADTLAIDRIYDDLTRFEEVSKVVFVDKSEAVKRFKSSLESIGSLLDSLPENPLPASFEITLGGALDIENARLVAMRIKNSVKGVDDVVYGSGWIDRFSAAVTAAKLIALVVGAFLLLATIFIVSNTVKLTVYARKDELEIMKLLGATNTFIRLPFYIEGMLQGLVGSALALVSLYVVYRFLLTSMADSLTLTFATGSFHLTYLPFTMVCYSLIGGMALGLVGSFVSLGRFLKV